MTKVVALERTASYSATVMATRSRQSSRPHSQNMRLSIPGSGGESSFTWRQYASFSPMRRSRSSTDGRLVGTAQVEGADRFSGLPTG